MWLLNDPMWLLDSIEGAVETFKITTAMPSTECRYSRHGGHHFERTSIKHIHINLYWGVVPLEFYFSSLSSHEGRGQWPFIVIYWCFVVIIVVGGQLECGGTCLSKLWRKTTIHVYVEVLLQVSDQASNEANGIEYVGTVMYFHLSLW